MFTKTIVYQNEPEIEVASESSHTTKKGGRSDSKGKKKVESKQGTDVSTVNEEVKPNVYEWKCVTSDGQVFKQNSINQEYEKINQLRLILETNPKTTEVVLESLTIIYSLVSLFSKLFIEKIKSLLSFVQMDLELLVFLMEQGKICLKH
jgi:hypothetical protein